jgi:hypothetical protein
MKKRNGIRNNYARLNGITTALLATLVIQGRLFGSGNGMVTGTEYESAYFPHFQDTNTRSKLGKRSRKGKRN